MTLTKTAAAKSAIAAISIEWTGRGWEVHHRTDQDIHTSDGTTYWAARAACTEKRTTHALIAMGYGEDEVARATMSLYGGILDRMSATIIKLEEGETC